MISEAQRRVHEGWLLDATGIPTAAGRESRVVEWVRRWVAERPEVRLTTDRAGNLHLAFVHDGGGSGRNGVSSGAGAPLYFTAHLDHPAFVVERVVGPGTAQVQFRGGVMEEYFLQARVVVHPRDGGGVGGVLAGEVAGSNPVFKSYLMEMDGDDLLSGTGGVSVGDVAMWDLPGPEIVDGLLHTPACDDLAALAAALAAFDVLRTGYPGSPNRVSHGEPTYTRDVRLLLTRAEEVGFIGAIAACEAGTMPRGSLVLALENSRSFEDSPIGGGPIVRVGDRMSVFDPQITDAVAKRAEEISGAAASERAGDAPWKWQRKLMSGGACEATVFCAAGYRATCLCLPLGNYHNMADLAALQAGTHAGPARVAREFISIADFHGLVDLLVACAERLPEPGTVRQRIERLWAERSFVLGEA